MSIEPKLGETITVGFITSSGTGGVIDATGTPVVEVFAGSNDTPVLTPPVTKRAGKTGAYHSDIALTQLNGFVVGTCYEVYGNATVSGQTTSALLDRFILRAYTVDGTNVKDVNGQPATINTGGVTLSPTEYTSIAVAVKTDTGHDTTTGSLGKQSSDMYATMAKYGGLIITGKVNASPTPSLSAFAITLDSPLPTGKTTAGLIGQFLTVRAGGAQTEANAITGCVIQSANILSLTFTAPGVFSAAPSTDDPVTISE